MAFPPRICENFETFLVSVTRSLQHMARLSALRRRYTRVTFSLKTETDAARLDPLERRPRFNGVNGEAPRFKNGVWCVCAFVEGPLSWWF